MDELLAFWRPLIGYATNRRGQLLVVTPGELDKLDPDRLAELKSGGYVVQAPADHEAGYQRVTKKSSGRYQIVVISGPLPDVH